MLKGGYILKKDLTRVSKGGILSLKMKPKPNDKNICSMKKRARLTRTSILRPGSNSQKRLSQERRSERKGNKRQERSRRSRGKLSLRAKDCGISKEFNQLRKGRYTR